ARLPLEVLHDVRDVGVRPIDAGLVERLVEEPTGRTDERPPGEVLVVARLFADEHHPSAPAAFTGNSLSAALPEGAGAAAGGGLLEILEGRLFRNQRRGGPRRLLALSHSDPRFMIPLTARAL